MRDRQDGELSATGELGERREHASDVAVLMRVDFAAIGRDRIDHDQPCFRIPVDRFLQSRQIHFQRELPSMPKMRDAFMQNDSPVIGAGRVEPGREPATGFASLGEIEGRDFDFVVTGSGTILHGQIFEDILDRYPGIRRWRVRQREDGSVRVLLEFLQRSPGSIVEDLQNRFSGVIEGYPVSVSIVKEIPAGASGKHRTIVSELSRNTPLLDDSGSPQESA